MSRFYSLYYIGYYTGNKSNDNILLCVGEDELSVQYYLQRVRCLSNKNSEIRVVTMDSDTAMSLYEDFMLMEYDDEFKYLTSRDIQTLIADVDIEMEHLQNLYKDLKAYHRMIKNIDRLSSSDYTFHMALSEMETHLSKVKNLKAIMRDIASRSPVLSHNINDYLSRMIIVTEDKKLVEQFYRKVDLNYT